MSKNHQINAEKYNVYIGNESLEELEKLLQTKYKNALKILVTDQNTNNNCLPLIDLHCPSLESAELIEVESGEINKSIDVVIQIWEMLFEMNADRNAVFINVGGGMISDIAGFTASTFKRGIDFINVPTSLLSMVDASVGGKVGIDFIGFKNGVGLYSNPQAVFIEPAFLETLEDREFKSGIAEIAKHALIADAAYWLQIQNADFRDYDTIIEIIAKSVNIKNEIVLSDFTEQGDRKKLNFGHTIGHAIETCFLDTDNELLHGEAVAIGMIAESYISNEVSTLTANDLKQISSFILKNFALTKIDETFFDELVEIMLNDKKNSNGKINFTLLKRIGECSINHTASKEEIILHLNTTTH